MILTTSDQNQDFQKKLIIIEENTKIKFDRYLKAVFTDLKLRFYGNIKEEYIHQDAFFNVIFFFCNFYSIYSTRIFQLYCSRDSLI